MSDLVFTKGNAPTTPPAGTSSIYSKSDGLFYTMDEFGVETPLKGATGATGSTGLTGPGVPVGGTTGQYLKKNSGTNYDTGWAGISASDVPTLNQNTTGTSANVTGTVAIANGGTGAATQQAAVNALTGTQAAGKYLRSDGTNAALSTIQAADVPTLNQNTTGTAVNVTGTVAIANGGTGVTSATTAPTASAFAGWDANKNLSANNLFEGYATTATAGATTALTVSSAFLQYFTGTTTQTVTLPVASTLTLGQQFQIVNNSTGLVTVQSSGGNTLQAMASNTQLVATCILTSGTGTASWNWSYQSVKNTSPGNGSVTSVGVTVGAGGMTVSGSPVTSSGTITLTPKVPTVQKFLSGSGTYTTPAGVLYIRVRMVGGGGGGAGSGSVAGTAAGAGGNSTFGTTLLAANGGGAGTWNTSAGGAGGTASLGTGPIGLGFTGATGQGTQVNLANAYAYGGMGGVSPFGGAGVGSGDGGAGGAAIANTGSGGGGAGGGATQINTGGGGGAGGFVDALITSPSATYAYAVGGLGSAGGAGTSGFAGGAGSAGIVIVEEFYQ